MNRPSVPEIIPLVQAYYKFPNCSCGGVLHIVLDDGNIQDDDILHCIKSAKEGVKLFRMIVKDFEVHFTDPSRTEPDEAGELLGRLLLLMTKTQRRKLTTVGYNGEPIDRATFITTCRELLTRYKTDGPRQNL